MFYFGKKPLRSTDAFFLHWQSPSMPLHFDDDLALEQFDFNRKNACCQGEIAKKSLEIAYDIFTVVVSLLDVITDIMVLIQFYSSGRMTFFYISLTILIVAQFAYTMAFWWKFADAGTYNEPGNALFACCCLLPLSPLLAYAFYFTSDESSPLFKFFEHLFECRCRIECCRSKSSNRTNDNNDPKQNALRKWVHDKLMKHLGFIIEALIEAFPQSILQLIAIVYYNDSHNYVSIFSILLSMISVSTKSFILSVKVSYNWKSALFNWISCLIDFIAIFCITSLIFYVPTSVEEQHNPFQTLQQIWFYSTCITVVPFTLVGSTVLACVYLFHNPECDFDCLVILVLIFALWIIGLCVATMLMCIAGFAAFSLLLIYSGSTRRLGKTADFYMPLVSFINNAKRVYVSDYYEEESALTISKKQHKVIRMCCVNRVLLAKMSFVTWHQREQTRLLKYLKERSVTKHNGDVPFMNATFKAVMTHSKKEGYDNQKKCAKWWDSYTNVPTYFYNKFHLLHQDNVCGLLALYCCLPLYFVGRCFNILFIVFMICYLYIGYDINVFSDDLPSFQRAMVSCYLGLLGVWSVLLYLVLQEQYYLSFILPFESKLIVSDDQTTKNSTTMQIMNYYHSVISQLVAQRYCVRLFGKDVAMIIIQLWGCGNDIFEDDGGDP
eukprot:62684_1